MKFTFVKLEDRNEWFLLVTKDTDFAALKEYFKGHLVGSFMTNVKSSISYKAYATQYDGILVRENGSWMTGTNYSHMMAKDVIEFPEL